MTDVEIEYLALLMCKDLTFTLVVKGKDNVLSSLAKELKRTSNSAYNVIGNLRRKGYLKTDEDNHIILVDDLHLLKQIVKDQLKSGIAVFDFLVSFFFISSSSIFCSAFFALLFFLLEEDKSSAYLGFRCAMTRTGSPKGNGAPGGNQFKTTKRQTKRRY